MMVSSLPPEPAPLLSLPPPLLPLLVEELKWNDRLARQLFQSAYVDRPQEAILNTCGRLGENELQRKLLEFLDCSNFPHDEIELKADEE